MINRRQNDKVRRWINEKEKREGVRNKGKMARVMNCRI